MIKGDYRISDARVAKAFLNHAYYVHANTSVVNTSHKCRKTVSMWVQGIEVARLETTQYNNKLIFVKFPELMSKITIRRLNAVSIQLCNRKIFSYHNNHIVRANENYVLDFDKWYSLDLFVNANEVAQ